MSDRIEPADAARALSEIGWRREQVIRRKVFPGWFWWAHAALIIMLTACMESGRGVLLWIGVAVFVIGGFVIDWPVSRAARAAAPRRGLAGLGTTRRTLIGLATFVAVLLGVLVTTALSLRAAGVPYPATIAATVTATVFAVAGRLLVRYEQAVQVRRSRSQG
jgi:hypothetical protein